MKKIFSSKLFLSFFFSFCLGALIVIPNMIVGGGIYSLVADYNMQQVPFNMLMNFSIKEGSILWTWYNELGSNFIGTFSFYNLFSPFNAISYLFPSNWIPYLNGIFIIFKYAVSGMTSYLFLKRYCKDKRGAVFGSLLYSFSGFILTNMLFHFHDVFALFPLLLYTLDNYMYDNKKGWFGCVVALLALTNWFFFIGQGVFFILYFLVKLFTKEYKWEWKRILYLIIEGVLSIGVAAIVLIPTAIFMFSNPRVGLNWTFIEMIKFPIERLIEIFRAFLLPSEVMNLRSFITDGNYTSVEIYLPLVGIILVIGCLIKNFKKWYSILFVICCIFMFIPILNSSFYMFNSDYYARWFYMPILIMSLMSVKCIEENIKLIKPLIINIILYVILVICVCLYMIRINNFNIIYQSNYFMFMLIIAVLSLIVTYLICNSKIKYKYKYNYLIFGVFIFVFVWGNYMTYYYKEKLIDDNYSKYLSISDVYIEENVRTNSSSSCLYNLGAVGRFNNTKSFNSNINGSNFEFYNSIGYERTVSTIIDNDSLNDYLGVKYIISCNEELDDYEITFEGENYSLYLNYDYKEFGFNVDKYISQQEYFKLSNEDKINLLGEYVVFSEEQIKKYKELFNKEVEYGSNEFKFLTNGFVSKIDSSGDTLAIYTIPYDDGWRATVNGKDVNIEKVDNGMMAIKINKGINEIEFSYFTPGLKSGIVISFISLFLYILYLYLIKIKKVI